MSTNCPSLVAMTLWGISTLSAAPTASAVTLEPRQPIKITYLGNAGWQIEDSKNTILVDPYLSEFKAQGTDNPQITEDDPIAARETAQIDTHVHKADYILITHGHDDHMLDA